MVFHQGGLLTGWSLIRGSTVQHFRVKMKVAYGVVQVSADGEEGLPQPTLPQLDARLCCDSLWLPLHQEPAACQLLGVSVQAFIGWENLNMEFCFIFAKCW